MCGPLVMALPVNGYKGWTKLGRLFLYHSARITTYAILGAISGLLGSSLSWMGWQSTLSIGVGALILLTLVIPFTATRLKMNVFLNRWSGKWRKWAGQFFKKRSLGALWMMGLLNGILPCGMVYLALATSLASGSAFTGALAMVGFGLGTLPLLVGLSWITGLFRWKTNYRWRRVIPLMAAVWGLWLIMRGLGWGISLPMPDFEPPSTVEEAPVICH